MTKRNEKSGLLQTAFGVTALACVALTAGAYAQDANGKLTVSVYLDTPGASSVLAGKYQDAIKELGSHGVAFQGDEVATSTNLCVAYIMSQQFERARGACDNAVNTARFDRVDEPLIGHAFLDEQLAIALTNRAVLNWLANRPDSATADAVRAHHLAPRKDFVSQNWVVLNSKPQGPATPAIAALR